jgi:MFS family permease
MGSTREPFPAAVRTRWLLVFLSVGAGVAAAFQVGKVPPALPDLRTSLGLSLVLGGWVISTYNAVGALCGVGMGLACDRFGYRRAVVAGLACIGTGSFLGSLAPGPAALLAARSLEGLGFIAVVVATPALIFRVAQPKDLGVAFGLWSCFMPLGTSSMMLVAPPMLAHFGWRGLWAANGAVVLLYAALFRFATRSAVGGLERAAGQPPRIWRNVRTVTSRAGPLLLAVSWAAYTMSYIIMMGFLPTLLIGRGFGAPAAAALTALVVAANMAGALGGGWLLKKGVPRWRLMATASCTMGACAFGIYAPASPEWLRLASCITFSAVGGLQPVSVIGAAPLYAPEPALVATTNGFINQCSYFAMVLGPPSAAALASAAGGWQRTPWILTSAAILALAAALALRKIPVVRASS